MNGQAGTWYVKGFVEATTNYAAAESNAVEFTISAAAGSINYTTIAVEKTLAAPAFTNPLTKVGDGTVTYARSDGTDICTVNASTGEVTLNGTAGTCTITATVTNSTSYTYATNTANYTLTVLPVLDLSLVTGNTTVPDGVTITGTLGGDYKISIAEGATVTLNGVTINRTSDNAPWAGITCDGDAIINLSGDNDVRGMKNNYAGLFVPEGSTLIIQGDGSLHAVGRMYAAGIGGSNGLSCGHILIKSGTITAESSYDGAGIGTGGAWDGTSSCGTITISGGTVTATGGNYGAGIGSAYNNGTNKQCHCAGISITGGTVTANGGNKAAGIGSGYGSSCGDVTITSGVTSVTASQGPNCPRSIGAGVNYSGGQPQSTCGTVTIGGVVGAISESPYTYVPPKALSAATAEDIGKVIGANGQVYTTVSAATTAGTTASAIIAYVGSAGSVDVSSATYKGLAIALTDANNGSKCQWYTTASGTCVSQILVISDAITYKNGIACTETLVNSNGSGVTTNCSGHTHAAARAASSYSTARPSGTSAWFLPSMGQWNLIVQGLATKKASSAVTTNLTTSKNDTYVASNLNSVITDAGGTGLSEQYWSSTECIAGVVWYVSFNDGGAVNQNKSNNYYVRSVLAF